MNPHRSRHKTRGRLRVKPTGIRPGVVKGPVCVACGRKRGTLHTIACAAALAASRVDREGDSA